MYSAKTLDVLCKNTVHAFALLYKKKEHKSLIEKKKYILNKPKVLVFTRSPNKCHNIFTKHLFLVVVSHSFIFYYFILTYKKLTPQ